MSTTGLAADLKEEITVETESVKQALVIGGTGPSGPGVVAGLHKRGYEVTILHSGQHEVDFGRPVEHIHGDVHFEETFAPLLADRWFDLVIASYGRHRITAEQLVGKTSRVVAVTGFTGYPSATTISAWGPLGQPLLLGDEGPWAADGDPDKFSRAVHRGEEAMLGHTRAGDYQATIIRPPIVYGQRALSPQDWSIVRRIRDGRRVMFLPDGGLKVDGRLSARNLVRAILGAVDNPEITAGKRYNVRDAELYTMRQRIELIASLLGAELRLVDVPYELGFPAHPLWCHARRHHIADDTRFRTEVPCRDPEVPAFEAIAESVEWLVSGQADIAEIELQLGDPFDYEAEDRLLNLWESLARDMAKVSYEVPPVAHPYRHPKKPNETWQRPAASSYTENMRSM